MGFSLIPLVFLFVVLLASLKVLILVLILLLNSVLGQGHELQVLEVFQVLEESGVLVLGLVLLFGHLDFGFGHLDLLNPHKFLFALSTVHFQ
jgi:hypothetical protein